MDQKIKVKITALTGPAEQSLYKNDIGGEVVRRVGAYKIVRREVA